MDNSPSSHDTDGAPDDESATAIELVAKELYDVMGEEVPFEDKARQALEIGRVHLGADNGHLTRIDKETDHWEAIVSTAPPDGNVPAGLEVELATTYCRRVLESSSQIAVHDAPNQGWSDDPAFTTHGLHCYIGTPLRVNGEQYGTVCFVSEDPRSTPFREDEKLLAEIISQMLEREQELDRMRDRFDGSHRLGNLGAWEVGRDENVRWEAGTRRIHEVDADFEPTLPDAIECDPRDDRQAIEEAVTDARATGVVRYRVTNHHHPRFPKGRGVWWAD